MPGGTARQSLIGFPFLGLLLRLLGAVLLVAVLSLGFVLGTQTGLRLVVAVAEELAPGMISVGRVDGRVLGELTLEEVVLELPGLSLRLGRLHLDWQPSALLNGRLRIADLSAADIDIVAAPAQEKPPSEPFQLSDISLPIEIDVDRVLVERLSFREQGAPDASAIRLTRAELSATAVADRVDLRRVAADLAQPEASATASGGARLTGDYPVDLKLDWRFQQPPALALTGTGSVGGNLSALEIQHRVDGTVVATLDATLKDVLKAPSWQGELDLERLDLPALVPDAPALDLTARLETRGSPDAFDYGLGAELVGPDIPATRLTLTGSGSSTAARIESLLAETLGGRIEAKGTAAWSPAISWDLAVTAADIDPGLQVPGLDGKVSLKADSRGGLDDGYDFGANLIAELESYPGAVVNLAGQGDPERVQLETLTVETLGGVIEGDGELTMAPALAWSLSLTADDLDPGRQYPGLDGRVGFRLSSAGGLDDGFDFKVQGSAAVADYPPAVVDIGGKGTAEAAVLEKLNIQVLNGRIDGTGRVAWAPELSWEAALQLADLDPGSLLADWPGRIGGPVQSQGRMTDQGPDLTARIGDVTGELLGFAVRLAAALSMQGETIRLESLSAGSGSARLTADGSLAGEELDFRFDVDSPDLAALVPGGAGSLKANGSVAGSLATPRLRLSLEGRDAEISGQGIAAIDGRLDLGPGAGGDFDIDINGSNLVAGGQRFETLSVKGSGRMDRHRLQASLAGPTLGVELALDGGLGEGFDYRGSIGELTLATPTLGTWRIERPAPIAYAGGVAQVGPLCLGNGAGSGGCVGFEQPQPGRFEASLDIDRLDFDILNPLLPELLVMQGYLRADGRFRGEGNELAGSARVEVPTGAIQLALDDESKDRLVFTGTRLDLRAGASALDARFTLPLTGLGGVEADLTLPDFRLDSGAAQALRGNLRLNLTELSRISNLFPDIDDVTGRIDGDMRLGGTLGAPDLSGELQVRGLGLRLPVYGTEVADANVTAASRGPNDFGITGAAEVGGGRVDLNGMASIAGGAPLVQLSVRGKDLEVADSREYYALLSLDMNVGVGAGGTAVRGEIELPEARIKPRTVPEGAVQPSPDVVLEAPDAASGGPPLSLDVLVKLGDKVSIDAFGLRGLLRGELRVTKAPTGDEILGDGQLKIVDGTYRVTLPTLGVLTAIGKPLTIEQGIVNFAKTPISNPGLVLNAQREGGDMTAGVRVLGTLRSPKLAFFSESDPDLTQSEITQYLVTGIPPKRDAEADSRALAVGTYVAPKIYMEYEGATSDTAETVKMRYDFSNHIELQAETGDTQGADIFFKWEN